MFGKNLEKAVRPEEGKENGLEKDRFVISEKDLSWTLIKTFKDVYSKQIANGQLGLIKNDFIAMADRALKIAGEVEKLDPSKTDDEVKDYVKRVAVCVQDDLNNNTKDFFGDPGQEADFKAGVNEYLENDYINPPEPETPAPEGGK